MKTHQFISINARWLLLLAFVIALEMFVMLSTRLEAQGPCEPKSQKPCDIPKGFVIVEGDIQVPETWLNHPEATFDKSTTFWTHGGNGSTSYDIPYEFDDSATDANVTSFPVSMTAATNAMNYWESVANLHFIHCTDDACPSGPHIHFQNSGGNNSPVGMQPISNVINIYNWNYEYIIAHELGHTLGYKHEQCRSDRNDYIKVITENIKSGEADQFCASGNNPTLYDSYGPYDFDSLMHYDECDFSKYDDCPSRPPPAKHGGMTIHMNLLYQDWQYKIGQRDHLSYWDEILMAILYPPDNSRFLDSHYTGIYEFGTFFLPYKQYTTAYTQTLSGGTLWILRDGTYTGITTFNKRMTIRAPMGAILEP